jgi:hypothetical protein
MFKRLKENRNDDNMANYECFFYAYLIIKEKFREELIQTNNHVGFANFNFYQDRKEIFFQGDDFMVHALHNMAVRTILLPIY